MGATLLRSYYNSFDYLLNVNFQFFPIYLIHSFLHGKKTMVPYYIVSPKCL